MEIKDMVIYNKMGNSTKCVLKGQFSESHCGVKHTHTQPFYGPFSGTTRVSRCQKRTPGLYSAMED